MIAFDVELEFNVAPAAPARASVTTPTRTTNRTKRILTPW